MKTLTTFEDRIEILIKNFKEQAEANGFKVNSIEVGNLRKFLRSHEGRLKNFKVRSGAVALLMYRLAGMAYNEIAHDLNKLKQLGNYVSDNYIMNTFHPDRRRRFHGSVDEIVEINPHVKIAATEYKFFA